MLLRSPASGPRLIVGRRQPRLLTPAGRPCWVLGRLSSTRTCTCSPSATCASAPDRTGADNLAENTSTRAVRTGQTDPTLPDSRPALRVCAECHRPAAGLWPSSREKRMVRPAVRFQALRGWLISTRVVDAGGKRPGNVRACWTRSRPKERPWGTAGGTGSLMNVVRWRTCRRLNGVRVGLFGPDGAPVDRVQPVRSRPAFVARPSWLGVASWRLSGGRTPPSVVPPAMYRH